MGEQQPQTDDVPLLPVPSVLRANFITRQKAVTLVAAEDIITKVDGLSADARYATTHGALVGVRPLPGKTLVRRLHHLGRANTTEDAQFIYTDDGKFYPLDDMLDGPPSDTEWREAATELAGRMLRKEADHITLGGVRATCQRLARLQRCADLLAQLTARRAAAAVAGGGGYGGPGGGSKPDGAAAAAGGTDWAKLTREALSYAIRQPAIHEQEWERQMAELRKWEWSPEMAKALAAAGEARQQAGQVQPQPGSQPQPQQGRKRRRRANTAPASCGTEAEEAQQQEQEEMQLLAPVGGGTVGEQPAAREARPTLLQAPPLGPGQAWWGAPDSAQPEPDWAPGAAPAGRASGPGTAAAASAAVGVAAALPPGFGPSAPQAAATMPSGGPLGDTDDAGRAAVDDAPGAGALAPEEEEAAGAQVGVEVLLPAVGSSTGAVPAVAAAAAEGGLDRQQSVSYEGAAQRSDPRGREPSRERRPRPRSRERARERSRERQPAPQQLNANRAASAPAGRPWDRQQQPPSASDAAAAAGGGTSAARRRSRSRSRSHSRSPSPSPSRRPRSRSRSRGPSAARRSPSPSRGRSGSQVRAEPYRGRPGDRFWQPADGRPWSGEEWSDAVHAYLMTQPGRSAEVSKLLRVGLAVPPEELNKSGMTPSGYLYRFPDKWVVFKKGDRGKMRLTAVPRADGCGGGAAAARAGDPAGEPAAEGAEEVGGGGAGTSAGGGAGDVAVAGLCFRSAAEEDLVRAVVEKLRGRPGGLTLRELGIWVPEAVLAGRGAMQWMKDQRRFWSVSFEGPIVLTLRPDCPQWDVSRRAWVRPDPAAAANAAA